MPNDFISQEAALSEVDRQIEKNPFGAIAYAAIAIKSMLCDLPASDVVPVIRCRACGRGQEADDGTGIVYCCWYSREVPGKYVQYADKLSVAIFDALEAEYKGEKIWTDRKE